MDATGETEGWGRRNARTLDTLGALALIIVLLFLFSQLLLAGRPLNFGFMASVFGILAWAAIFAVILTTVCGATAELLQVMVPGRAASLLDCVLNGIGAAASATFYLIFNG